MVWMEKIKISMTAALSIENSQPGIRNLKILRHIQREKTAGDHRCNIKNEHDAQDLKGFFRMENQENTYLYWPSMVQIETPFVSAQRISPRFVSRNSDTV
jgi:hypothetical protein